MAIHIPMRKTSEDDKLVVYEFIQEVWGPAPEGQGRQKVLQEVVGTAALDKATGQVVFIADVPRQEFYGPRVERRLKQAFESGEYLDEMAYSA